MTTLPDGFRPIDLEEDDGVLWMSVADADGNVEVVSLGDIERAEDSVPEGLGPRYSELLDRWLDGVRCGAAYRREVEEHYRESKGF